MIEMVNVSKVYKNGVTAVNKLSVKIEQGEFVYIVGPSGAGKSTFIKMLYREEKASEGSIKIGKFDLMKIKEREVPMLRRSASQYFR